MIDFLNSLITEQGFSRGFVVFSKADEVLMDPDEEESEIELFKESVLSVAPQAELFLNSVKYLFYRHSCAYKGDVVLTRAQCRREFLNQAYSEIFKLCEANNGKTFSTAEMMKAKKGYDDQNREIEAYERVREENYNGKNSTDLIEKIGQIQECAPSSFEVPECQTQDEDLRAWRLFDGKVKNLIEEIRQLEFLEKQLNEVSKNLDIFK
ncbi:hypothetical protein ROZALSC1DRAFT_25788 [Rozella allomycis CSF55]|uniref:AIG1-type G domain-containing protein n=1 Tax=Rozella allomycis (strain CSF55) TaxID=988480 RepID=A0A4P9YAX0_ROZAC|nr:hypothetical protein ROZALSC1DRAFT_25789 [Rozella allomycis CSF55]RKP15994.1 hypothetical protein ROZALSC1DRAFT_25788 [Rozella allomycis CSF55]